MKLETENKKQNKSLNITISLISKLPECTRKHTLEAWSLAWMLSKKNTARFEGVEVKIEMISGVKFKTYLQNLDEDNIILSDQKGHLRIIKIAHLKKLRISNYPLINQIHKSPGSAL